MCLCHIFRFDRPQIESYNSNLVFENSSRFFDYLGKKSFNIDNSIVPYVLRSYRQIRNEVRTDNSGIDSLRALLFLLAYSRDGDDLILENWGLPDLTVDLIQTIDHNKWNFIVENFISGVQFTDKWLKPNVDLILRHAAGKLFEEANYIAYLPPQLTLFPDEIIKYSYDTIQNGAYFTPSYIARSIVEEVLRNIRLEDKQTLTIFDPACGASGFLVEALRQLKKANYNRPVNIIGWDKAETAVIISRFVLNFEKQEWDELNIDVRLMDSLAEDSIWPQDVDILLMNPPFLSWDRMKDKPEVRGQVLRILPGMGRANLSAAFLAKAVETLSPTGVLGALLPTQLLNDQRYEPLRDMIRDSISLRMIGGLGSFVFDSVQTYTSMFIASKGSDNVGETTILWTKNIQGAAESGLRALRKHYFTHSISSEDNFSVYGLPFDIGQKSWKIDNYQNLKLKSRIEGAVRTGVLKRVKDLFSVHLGARTGNNKVFIVTGDFVKSLPFNERRYFRPSVDNLAIDNGHLYKVNYIFYPYTKDIEYIENEDQLAALLPETYGILLLPARTHLGNRSSLKGNPRWWELSEHCAWQEKKELKLVSSEFGHAGSFAIDYTGEFAVERGTMWEFRKKGWTPRIKYYEAYLAILNSPFMNTILSIYGEQLAGGDIYKLGKSYIGNLPLPDLSLPMFERYIQPLRQFAQLMKDDLYWDSEKLNDLVKKIFYYGD